VPNSSVALLDNFRVIVLIGPGGVGKGTIARALIAADPSLWLSRSWTTRTRRESESGDEYVFVARKEFEYAIERDGFFEWAEFHGNLYGTPMPSPPVGCDVLLEIDVQGAQQVLERLPSACVILIKAPSMSSLEDRLMSRGDSMEHVAVRLASTPNEIAIGEAIAREIVVNDDLTAAVSKIQAIIEELRRTRPTNS